MAEYTAPQFGNVYLMDPNMVNVNPDMTNSIPQYQDMHIFAELTAQRKGRTVLAISSQGTSIQDNGMNSDMVVNFMGNNQDPENPNFTKFTTNYYDGSSGDRTQYEGFGISNIKVVINSSYIPQVDIEFVDVRGLAFFNQENSPYRILFDFPPPVFNLTLKGYYGMALEYKLHLVKYTSEFKSENGNFVVNAQFVAVTFAPLSDVLFRYVINFPLINNPVFSNPSPSEEPKNTYELILKIKNLFTQYNEKKNTTPDTEEYNYTVQQLGHNSDVMAILSGYKSNSILQPIGNPQMFIKNNSFIDNGGDELVVIDSPAEYDDYLKKVPTDGIQNNLSQRLIIGFLISENIPITAVTTSIEGQNRERIYVTQKALNSYKTSELIGRANAVLGKLIEANDIPPATELTSKNKTATSQVTDIYAYIDVSQYYVKLYKQRIDLLKKKSDVMTIINEKINDLVLQNLGMKPTIYNIFKIILNDVDRFFNILRNTSAKAEEHHTKYHNLIIDDPLYKDTKKNIVGSKPHIFSWPLVVKQEKICNQIKESRTVPIEMSQKVGSQTGEPFPEIGLLKNFIDTFSKQQKITEQLNMRAEQNADGSNKWIPISPVDSKLATADMASPYLGLDNSNGGSGTQPINLSSDPKLVQVFNKVMERFYVLSQSSFADSFYLSGKADTAVANMFSESEAINLAVSITNTEFTNMLLTAAKRYGVEGRVDEFYDYLNKHKPEIADFNATDKTFIQISNGDLAYTNKKDPRYQGFEIYSEPIATQTEGSGDSNNPITKFQNDVNLTNWQRFKNGGDLIQSFYKFTEENVFYVPDVDEKGTGLSSGVESTTRFLSNWSYGISMTQNDDYEKTLINFNNTSQTNIGLAPMPGSVGGTSEASHVSTYNRIEAINKINENNNGNFGLTLVGARPQPDAKHLQLFTDITALWSSQLSTFDTEIVEEIISGFTDSSKPEEYNPNFNSRLSALILMSSFGYALSPFNQYPSNLNKYLFNIPAAIQIPEFLPIYLGALIGIDKTSQEYKDIYNFFVSGSGKNLSSSGAFIFADIVDVNNYLSETDKTVLKNRFNTFYGNGATNTPFYFMILYLKELYSGAQKAYADATENKDKVKKKFYEDALNVSTGSYFSKLLEPLIHKIALLNFSQLTFKREMNTPVGFDSIKTTNSFSFKKEVNDNYFKNFFIRLSSDIIKQQNKILATDQANNKLSGDDDILTQCYYSFKNINDKWLTGPLNTQSTDANAGYPFGESVNINKKLIDAFVFVDRAMNPIGDTIINPEILSEMMDNPNVSVFSVLSQILSMNGFEFFPLQNFLKFEERQWEESFKIDTSIRIKTGPTFVCMYIGGGSSYPTGINYFNQFEDDGITDLANNTATDFSTYIQDSNPCSSIPSEDNQMANNPTFPFRQVRAFKVRFGEQNQSMFKDIKIDSKDYPETNESLHILSKLAGDNKLQAPPAKGQNLYNTFENRAYKATISGMGNVMIQPTQYFQLENVPIFNGAYVILSVEHNVEPNRMITSFSGMKILEYPVPRVMQSSAILGFEGGNTDETNPALSSAEEVTIGVGTAGNPDLTQFNSMYDFKIQ